MEECGLLQKFLYWLSLWLALLHRCFSSGIVILYRMTVGFMRLFYKPSHLLHTRLKNFCWALNSGPPKVRIIKSGSKNFVLFYVTIAASSEILRAHINLSFVKIPQLFTKTDKYFILWLILYLKFYTFWQFGL